MAEDCAGVADQVHHRLRRSHGGGNAESNLLAACNACHVWIHRHTDEAVEMGLLVNGTRCADCQRPSPEYLCPRCRVAARKGRYRVLGDDGRYKLVDVFD